MRIRIPVALAAILLCLGAGELQKEDPAVTELLRSIKGQENKPAGEVFKNVKVLRHIPAGRLLRIMDLGYARALGVGCDHCHSEGRWDADEKRPKLAAREMALMTEELNKQLAVMDHIDNSEATVNCTTCHRGYVKPATQMR